MLKSINSNILVYSEIFSLDSEQEQLTRLCLLILEKPVALLSELKRNPQTLQELTCLLNNITDKQLKELIFNTSIHPHTLICSSLEILFFLQISAETLSVLNKILCPDQIIMVASWLLNNQYREHAKRFLTNPGLVHLFIKNNEDSPEKQKALLEWCIEDRAAIVKKIYHSVEQLSLLYEFGLLFMRLEDFHPLFNRLVCTLERLSSPNECHLLQEIHRMMDQEKKDLLELCAFSGMVRLGHWVFFDNRMRQYKQQKKISPATETKNLIL